MILQCKTCNAIMTVTSDEVLAIVDELIQTVVGRDVLRQALQRNDKRARLESKRKSNPLDDNKTLTNRVNDYLTKARHKANLTQIDLAEKLGISRFTLVRWEAGATNPSLEVYRQWAAALSLTLKDIFVEVV